MKITCQNVELLSWSADMDKTDEASTITCIFGIAALFRRAQLYYLSQDSFRNSSSNYEKCKQLIWEI